MTDVQQAAQSLAVDIARFRQAERAAAASLHRLAKILNRVVVFHLQVN